MACSVEITWHPRERSARHPYPRVRLDLTIRKPSYSCGNDPRFGYYNPIQLAVSSNALPVPLTGNVQRPPFCTRGVGHKGRTVTAHLCTRSARRYGHAYMCLSANGRSSSSSSSYVDGHFKMDLIRRLKPNIHVSISDFTMKTNKTFLGCTYRVRRRRRDVFTPFR